MIFLTEYFFVTRKRCNTDVKTERRHPVRNENYGVTKRMTGS